VAKRKHSYTNGQVIYREGDVSDRAFEVISGAVELVRDGPEGDTRIGVARGGEMFGESGLIEGGYRESTARAVGAVVVRAIQRDSSDQEENPPVAGPGLMRRLLERFGGQWKTAQSVQDEMPSSNGKPTMSPGLIQRMMDSVHPPEGRIEIRVACLCGDNERAHARHLASAMGQFRNIRVKLIDDQLEVDLNKGLAKELARVTRAGRRVLRRHDGDLLIWGHVPPAGAGAHLHFIARGDWDERLPGAFAPSTDLPLPADFDEKFANLVHAVLVAATRPKRGEQAALRTALLPELLITAAQALSGLPAGLSTRERASVQVCYGNIHAALWAQTRQITCLDNAYEIYQGVLSLLSGDEAAIDGAVVHKHLSAISFIRAEEGGGRAHYEEAAAAALAALESLNPDDHLLDWAALHYRLGLIHYKLGFDSGDADVLRRALRHHRNALRTYSRKLTPGRWVEAMAAFGQAAQVFGEHVKSLEALATAVNACRAVLQVRDRNKTPLAWAAAQNNLGSALFLLGRKARNPQRLEPAIMAFESALEVYRGRDLHHLAAVTEKNLERAQDMIEWYSPEGIAIVDMDESPVATLTARKTAPHAAHVRSSQAIEVIE
jgi:tetratricopeptide (TPR) repeat protein